MQTQFPQIQVQFTLQLPPELPEEVEAEAKRMAKEAYVMALLKHGIISSGRAGRLLGMHRLDVIELMGKYGISVFAPQTQLELEQEVAQTLSIAELNANIISYKTYTKQRLAQTRSQTSDSHIEDVNC